MDLREVRKDLPAFFVCRIIDKPIEDIIQIDGDGKTEILDIDELGEHIVGLSVNLMGALYNESHFKYRTKGTASKYWTGEKINMAEYDGLFDELPQAFPIYYCSDTLHRIKLPWCIPAADKGRKNAIREAFGEKCIEFFGNQAKGSCEVFIAHKPTILNYWHMQVEMKPELENDEKSFKNDKAWRKDIYVQFVSDILSKKFLKSLPEGYSIEGCLFCGLTDNCRMTEL